MNTKVRQNQVTTTMPVINLSHFTKNETGFKADSDAFQSADFTNVLAAGLRAAPLEDRYLFRFGFLRALMPATTSSAFNNAPAGVECVRASPKSGATFSGPRRSNSRA